MVKASATEAVGRGFAPRPRHTKDGKNGTGSSLDQLANLYFHFTSVPRCTPVEVQRNTDGDTPSSSSLADARNIRVVPGRYKKAGRYSLLVMSQ